MNTNEQIAARLAPVLYGLERRRAERHYDQCLANARAHRLTRTMSPGARATYTYYRAGVDGRGRKVRFCIACHRNAAGYFLVWREVVGKRHTTRDRWDSERRKRDADALAKSMRDQYLDDRKARERRRANRAQIDGSERGIPL